LRLLFTTCSAAMHSAEHAPWPSDVTLPVMVVSEKVQAGMERE
jgi:hypothetical protein